MNNNDSNGDGDVDKDNDAIDGESDLADMRKLRLVLDSPGFTGHVKLSCGPGDKEEIRVFKYDGSPDSAQPVIGPGLTDSYSYSIDDGSETLVFYVEGLDWSPSMTSRLQITLFDAQSAQIALVQAAVGITPFDTALVADYDRDGKIEDDDCTKAKEGKPFYFWINDDDDEAADEGEDRPGAGRADWKDSVWGVFLGKYVVDSVRDYVDFFPVWVNIKDTLLILSSTEYDYVLKHADGALNAFINPGLAPAQAGRHLRDREFCEANDNAELVRIKADGYTLPADFLTAASSDNKALILLEGRAATQAPLVLEIRRKSDGSVVSTRELNLSIDGVEKMFRHKNLHAAAGGTVQVQDRTDAPNYPDALCSSKHVLFVHGYNVNQQDARAWQSEMFKRFYWSGSKAKFWGVSWRGDHGQIPSWIPILGDRTPNYHANAIHALDTADDLAAFISTDERLAGQPVVVVAHSLGNMVSAAAIARHNAPVSQFIMLDAAVPIEALDSDPSLQSLDMVHKEWSDYLGQERLWCSEWYKLFDASDGRRNLKWRDYFAAVRSKAYNLYSPGDQVLKAHPHDSWPGLWSSNLDGDYAWSLQEKLKGRMWVVEIGGSTVGGWGFNSFYDVEEDLNGDGEIDTVRHRTAAETQALTPEDLRERPFFRPGGSATSGLYDPATGGQFALDNLHKLLAGFVPARTHPVGLKPVPNLDLMNFNMQAEFQNGWPACRGQDPIPYWRHNDIREMAYVYIHAAFDKIRDLGGLDQ